MKYEVMKNGHELKKGDILRKDSDIFKHVESTFLISEGYIKEIPEELEGTKHRFFFRKEKWEIQEELQYEGYTEEEVSEVDKYAMTEIEIEVEFKNGKFVNPKILNFNG